MSKEKVSARGAEAIFAAAMLYSFSAILVRGMGTMWTDAAQVAVRALLTAALLYVFYFFQKNKIKVPKDKLAETVTLGISFALVVLFFTLSIQKTTIANSMFTFYASTMISSFLLGTFFLKEKVSLQKAIAIVVALIGLSVYTNALLVGSLGIIFGILAGCCDGFSNVLRKRLRTVDRNAVVRLQYLVGAVFVGVLTLLAGEKPLKVVTAEGIFSTIAFSILLIFAANLLLYGYKHFDVNMGSVISSTELVFATLLAYLFFKEIPSGTELFGGALIFVASIIAALDSKKFNIFKKPIHD